MGDSCIFAEASMDFLSRWAAVIMTWDETVRQPAKSQVMITKARERENHARQGKDARITLSYGEGPEL